jgi:cardiolipin synthase A/B
MDSTLYLIVSSIAIGFMGLMLLLALFEPALPYRITRRPNCPLDSPEFQRLLASLASGQVHQHNQVEVLTNGEVYYEAELQAIRDARRSVHLEAYIFQKGVVARRFLEALAERARAGVEVRMVLDAVGSFATWRSYLKELTDAGGQVYFYHPVRWYTLPRINNRTHRELLIVDGSVGFLGGAGFGDHWLLPHGARKRKRRWRDTMFRVEGPAVRDLQSAFAENWLETSGEVLFDLRCFRWIDAPGNTAATVVASSPSSGRATRNRMLYQTLLAAAQKSIHITTPYFLPDHSARGELIRAVQERGVDVKVIVPGKHADHLLTRRSSRRLFGSLLKAGIRIYEYKPAMIHAKVLLIDGMWSVVGSTNFDNRSFGINDEVNLAGYDPELAARLEADFETDLASSEPVNYRTWSRRSILERWHEYLGWLLERQQ